MSLLSTVTILSLLFSFNALAKVELLTSKKTPTDAESVQVTFYDKGQFKDCEEMGIIHSQAFWGEFSTKKGMIKRMKKQAAKVGATHILLKDTGHNDYSGSNVGNGIVFYCSEKK